MRFALCLGGLALALQASCASVDRAGGLDDLYPRRAAAAPVDWRANFDKVLPPLQNARGERWPLVLWHGVGFEPLAPPRARALLARGLVQHLRLRRADIEAARVLRDAGAPIVLMEGAGGAWPYDTVGDDKSWRLRFPADTDVPPAWRRLADPTRLAGWQTARDLTRRRLERYKRQGIEVDAVWLDYEGALLHEDYPAVRASSAASRLHPSLLESEHRYRAYRRAYWLSRLSRYLAAPARQTFPGASVTNWVVMLSSATHPVLSWTDWRHPPSPPTLFTHSNPIAYGIDTYFHSAWPEGHAVDRDNVDRFYTHLLLRQVSQDARNRARQRPDMGAVAWVARWVPDHPDTAAPMMSRAAYREALRHIWLRGADAMQVFNPAREGYERYAVQEVVDVQRVYDEMLEYREFLDKGEVMRFEVPDNRMPSILWSGLRLDDRALVRVSNLGTEAGPVRLCFTENHCRTLEVPARGGRTEVLSLRR